MKNNKGVTLIELIMILALIGIIITPIFSFLLTNIKAYNREDTEIELSFESEKITNYLSRHISDDNNDFINSYTIQNKELKHNGATIGKFVEVFNFKPLSNNKGLEFTIILKKDNITKESTLKINLRNKN